VLKSNQYWLSREEIKKRIAASESGQEADSTTFTTVDPKKRKVETDWSQLGSGQTLTGEPQASRSDDIENEAIKQAIAESAKELSDPKPEPAANAPDVVSLLVRFPSGQRLTRRFSVDSTSTEDVFEWLEIAAAKAGTLLPAEYGLVGRGWRLNKKRGADLSLSLKSTGLAPGQEAVNLQL
jgi:hypothetical protein